MESPASILDKVFRRVSRWTVVGFTVCAVGGVALLPRAASPAPPVPSPRGKSQRRSEQSRFTPLNLDPYSAQDPLFTFHQWRMKNRVSLPVIPSVVSAHKEWLRYHQPGKAQGGKAPVSAGSPAVGTNICAAGGVSGYQGEVSIAVNPNNPQDLVAGANTFYQDPTQACQSPSGTTYGTQALYGSSDGGQTWTYNCAPWPSSLTGGVNGANAWFGSDPSMAWDANGNAYASYMLISQNSRGTSGAAIVVAESTDSGVTWSPVGIVVNNIANSSNFDDKDMMAIDTTSGRSYSHTNRLYVIWDENNTERVAYSDNGTSWTTVVVENAANAGSDIGGDLAVGPDGTVYAIWDRLPAGGDTHVFAKSTDGGQTWSTPVQVAIGTLSSFGTNNSPPAQDKRGINAFGAIAVDTGSSPYSGTIYVVYPDFPSGVSSGTDVNIYEIHSSDGGSTWTAPVKVNDDTGTATQFFPWVAVDPTSGDVVVSWYDTRNDPNNRKTQMFFAYSTDGGQTFQPNVQVTQASNQFSSLNSTVAYSDENSTDNTNYNANQYGDYAQITAQNGEAWVIWTDTRQFYPSDTGNAKREDVAVASVSVCTPPGTPSGLSASVPGDNQIGLSWSAGSPAGSTYNVYRAIGSCASPGAFSLLATGVSGTSYTDSTVSGGTTYAYEVTAVDSTGGCESGLSACASATATGKCTMAPTFAGLTSVSSPGNATCEVDLAWTAATPNCGTSVTYNVYRATSASFVPSASNMIATGVVGTSFGDTSALVSGTTYYYIVRAVDVSNGAEDGNLLSMAGFPTGTTAVDVDETFEEAGGQPTSGGTWTHSAGTGTDNWAQSTGGAPHSPTHTFFCPDVTTRNDDYLVTPVFAVPQNASLSFWHTYYLESGADYGGSSSTGYDGAVIEISTDGGSTWSDLGSNITQGGYTSTISSSYGSPIAGRQAWSGGSIGTETQVLVDLSSFAGQNAQIRFRLACDQGGGDTGWYIDDVVVSGYLPCTTGISSGSIKPVPDGQWVGGTPMEASKATADGGTVNLSWDTSCHQDPNYNLYYGVGSQIASYTLSGSQCGLGNSGSASWSAPAVPSGEHFIWWIIAGTDGAHTESSWGKDSAGNERHPAASGECGFTAKSTATSCP